jgi:hypothetical protein
VIGDTDEMKKPVEPLAATFDLTEFLLKELGEITNHQTNLPRALKPNSFFTCSTNLSLPTAIDSHQRSSRRAMSPLDPTPTHSRCAFLKLWHNG